MAKPIMVKANIDRHGEEQEEQGIALLDFRPHEEDGEPHDDDSLEGGDDGDELLEGAGGGEGHRREGRRAQVLQQLALALDRRPEGAKALPASADRRSEPNPLLPPLLLYFEHLLDDSAERPRLFDGSIEREGPRLLLVAKGRRSVGGPPGRG